MKKVKILLLIVVLCIINSVYAQEITPSNKPNKSQKLLQERGYGMFLHFGVNTFADLEWSDGKIPASQYNPTHLDVDQWVQVARQAGFRYILLVTKHLDGFCLWDSKYTEHDVASSPVKTDIVAEVSKACKKYGIEFAVYYSLWDRNHPTGIDRKPKKYVDYMCNQLTELLTNYGDICEVWLDGGWDRPVDDWELPRVYKLIKELQPDCVVGVNHTIALKEGERKHALPDSMIVDNKYTFQYFPGDFRLWDPKIAHKSDKKQYLHNGESYYLPFEHTICISNYWSWFQKSYPQPTRDLDELEELFYWCTDNGNTLLLNLPPDRTGRIRENEANTAILLAQRLNLEYGKPLPKNGDFISMNTHVYASSVCQKDTIMYAAENSVDGGMQTKWMANDTLATLTINLDESKSFNKISIFEECDIIDKGDFFSNIRVNRIEQYYIEIWLDNRWQVIFADNRPMGDCKVINFPKSYKTSKLRFNITQAKGIPAIYEFNVISMPLKNI